MFAHMQWLIDIIKDTVAGVPAGTVIFWTGTIATVPKGWQQCNGDLGTPDLRDHFIMCKGLTHGIYEYGGETSHDHKTESTAHTHTFPVGSGLRAGIDFAINTGTHTCKGDTDSVDHIPPYYVLIAIMKL